MGIISINRSSARLSTIPGVNMRQVSTPRVPVINDAAKSQEIKSRQAVAHGVASLGKSMMDVALTLTREKRRAEDNETEAAFEKQLREGFMGADGKGGVYASIQGSTNTSNLTDAATFGQQMVSDEALKDFLDKREYSRNNRDDMLLRLRRATRPYEMRLQQSVLDKSKEISIAAADKYFNEKQLSWQQDKGSESLAADMMDAFAQAQELRGVPSDKVLSDVDKLCRACCFDIAKSNIASSSRDALSQLEAEIKDNPDSLYLKGRDGAVVNPKLAEYFLLKGASAFSPTEVKALQTEAERRRDELDLADANKVNSLMYQGDNALTTAQFDDITNSDGSVSYGIESSLKALKSLADSLPNNSKAKHSAIKAASDLDKSADGIAAANAWMKILQGEYGKDKSGLEVRPQEGTREAKNYEELYANYEAQMKAFNDAETRAKQAARADSFRVSAPFYAVYRPGEFLGDLVDASRRGEITPKQFLDEKKYFDETWAKMAPDKLQRMVDRVRSVFPEAFNNNGSETFGYKWEGGQGHVVFDKNATFDGINYTDKQGKKQKLSKDDTLALMDYFVLLEQHDGEMIYSDPETGVPLEDRSGKIVGRKLNASQDFNDFIERLKMKAETRAASELLAQRMQGRIRMEANFSKLYMVAAQGASNNKESSVRIVKKPTNPGNIVHE